MDGLPSYRIFMAIFDNLYSNGCALFEERIMILYNELCIARLIIKIPSEPCRHIQYNRLVL